MNEVRWKLKTFSGKAKTRTGYVLEQVIPHVPCALEPVWGVVTIEDSDETLVFDQYPLGQAVPKIKNTSDLEDVEEDEDKDKNGKASSNTMVPSCRILVFSTLKSAKSQPCFLTNP